MESSCSDLCAVSRLCGATFRSAAPQPLTPQRRGRNAAHTPGSLSGKWGGEGGRKISSRGVAGFWRDLNPSFYPELGGLGQAQTRPDDGGLFLCLHSFVMPPARPIYCETVFREYRDALHPCSTGRPGQSVAYHRIDPLVELRNELTWFEKLHDHLAS